MQSCPAFSGGTVINRVMKKELVASGLAYLKDSSPQKCPVRDVIEMIRANPKASLIEVARRKGKESSDYDKIKQSVRCWMPNGVFIDGGADRHFEASSGLIYIDIDAVVDVEQCKKEIMSLDFAYAAWRSFGGNGIGALVRVNGIVDKSSFKRAWDQIQEETNLEIDKQTRTLSRRNVISSDPSILVNESCTPYELRAESVMERTLNTRRTLTVYSGRGEKKYYVANDRSDTIVVKTKLPQELFNNQPFVVFDEGREYCDIYIHGRSIPDGRRRLALLSIIAKLWYMNPFADQRLMLHYVHSLNEAYCKPPMESKELCEIFDFITQRKELGALRATVKIKYIWFNPEMRMTKRERAIECQKVSVKIRNAKTRRKIIEAFWRLVSEGKKIRMIDLSRESGVSERTLRRRKDEFRHMITGYNESLVRIEQNIIDFDYYSDYDLLGQDAA